MGFHGFRELRSQLSHYFNKKNIIDVELSEHSTVNELVHKVFDISLQTIVEGKSIVNSGVIEEASKIFLMRNKEIYMRQAAPVQCVMILPISF